MFTSHPGTIVDAAGGALIALLGIWVLFLRPRTQATRTLGVVCVSYGLAFFVHNLVEPTASIANPTIIVVCVLLLLASASLLMLAAIFPRPIAGVERAWFWGTVAGSVLLTTIWSISDHTLLLPGGVAAGATGSLARVGDFLFSLVLAVVAGVVLFLGARSLMTNDAQEKRQYQMLTAAFLLWIGYTTGALAYYRWGWLFDAVLACLVVTGALFLVQTSRGPGTRGARNVALLCFAMPATGMLAVLVLGGSGEGGYGLARLLMVLLLVYAILRHSMLGIDAKVRFAISKSTLAAIFIAVFFIASEAAQQFFGDTFSSRQYGAYMGIAAAGGLVFVFAPMQRLADRIAEKAVPLGAAIATAGKTGPREESYLDAIRWALRDRRLTRAEEAKLSSLAEQLGIGAKRAHELLVQAETEAGVA